MITSVNTCQHTHALTHTLITCSSSLPLSLSLFFLFCANIQVRLQKEANHQIEKLALQAHNEALANLDRRTRSVYRENAVMADALSLHVSEEQALREQKERLEMANR